MHANTRSNRLRVVRSSDPRALLAAAADAFLETTSGTDPFASPPFLLALRQGGLRDDLIGLAAARGVRGWFDPPVCLFQQLHEWLGSTDRVPAGDYERIVLLSRLLRTHSPAVFARMTRPDAFVDAVDRMFGELVADDIAPGVFEDALEARADRDAFEIARDGDLAGCYRAYIEALERSGRRDGRDRLADTARAVRADHDALAKRLGRRRQIRIVGLQDTRGGWRVLLPALLSSPALDEIAIYSTTTIEMAAGIEPDIIETVGPPGGLVERLFMEGDDAAPPHVPVAMLSAPDADRETEEVAARVRSLIDSGVRPSAIAVVARSARPYVDRIVDALTLYGVPATARRRHAFEGIPVVRAVLALFAVAAEGWTRHGLVELADQPYFGRMTGDETGPRRLDPVVINHIGYRRRVRGLAPWIEAHRALRDAALDRDARLERGEDDPFGGRDAPPPAFRCENALASFTSFATLASELDAARTTGGWVGWLRSFLAEDPWRIESRLFSVPASRYDVARIDAAGLRGMQRIVDEWQQALAAWSDEDHEIDVVAFESLLREMLSGDAALWTPTRRGVQVLEGLAAAQRAFDHVFLVGMSGDTFPLRAQRSPIFDERERIHLTGAGVPLQTRADWDRSERALFRALVASTREALTLSWPRSDGEGGELVPSAFVEEIVIASGGAVTWPTGDEVIPTSRVAGPSLPLIHSVGQREPAVHAAMIERRRRSGEISAWNGAIEDSALLEWLGAERLGERYVWSPTQIEAYAKCPWSWFSQRLLRVDDLDDPDIDIDPLTRGAVLHDALRRFYDSAKDRLRGPVFLRTPDLAWIGPVLEDALEHAIAATGTLAWLGAPALHAPRKNELQRLLTAFVEWEIDHNEKHFNTRSPRRNTLRTGVDAHELAFGPMTGDADTDEDVMLDLGGVEFRLRGSIDRVETGIDDRAGDAATFIAAVDYKSSTWSTPGSGKKDAWADGVVLQVPLYAHILERLRPGTKVARVEYRAMKQREAVHSMELYRIDGGQAVVHEETAEQMELALRTAGRHVQSAREGRFPANPAPSCNCPPWCHAWDICRVAGGPRTSW